MRLFLRQRDQHLATWEKAESKLNGRKEKLWNTGDTAKWELDPSTDLQNLRDKATAFSCMVPKETEVVKNLE
jgi:hypothetical protein